MLLWSLQIIFMSVVVIFLCHHLFYFFMDLLTTKHTRDLVGIPTKKYENIYKSMVETQQQAAPQPKPLSQTKHELKLFMDSQINKYTDNAPLFSI